MKITWIGLADRIFYELRRLEEETGKDITYLKEEWNALNISSGSEADVKKNTETFYQKLEQDFNYQILSQMKTLSLEEIKEQNHIQSDIIPEFSDSFISDRIYGGWLGRCAGCLLGKPVEKTTRNGIIELLSSNNTWPIDNYITSAGIPEELLKKYPWNKHNGKESLRENIVCMPEDDDINYAIINLIAMEKYGSAFQPDDILQTWLDYLPVLSTFTAERVAYLNVLAGHTVPFTARFRNPYCEWIGAQIRSDFWGWISPAQPELAVSYAWKDAVVSHVRNGVYAEMFISAAIALAFKLDRMTDIIEAASMFVPRDSKIFEVVQYVTSLNIQRMQWTDIVNILYNKYGHYHWVHCVNNFALVVAALLSAEGDYERGICNVVMGGWDTDSNGATVGSVLGTMLGAKNLPMKWIEPLNNQIRSSIKGCDKIKISELTQRTAIIANYKKKSEGIT